MKRLVSQYDDEYYTCMLRVLKALGGRKLKYKWLITDIEAYPQDNGVLDKLIEENREYLLLTTDELMSYLEIRDFQWIWGVFSAIPTEYSNEEIFQYDLPFAAGNSDIYRDKPVIQHPLAEIEVVAHDALYFQVTARNENRLQGLKEEYKFILDDFLNAFFHFVTNDKRTSTAYYEFQFCKLKKPIRNLFGKEHFANLSFWKDDSLCLDRDYFEDLTDFFPIFLKVYSINGNTHFYKYGPNYYSKEMTLEIISEIKRLTNNKEIAFVKWLERAVNEYNGFYILGI